MLEEVKVAVQKEREALKAQQDEVQKDKKQLEEYKKIKEDEALSLKSDLDKKMYEFKELDLKHSVMSEQYRKIENRY